MTARYYRRSTEYRQKRTQARVHHLIMQQHDRKYDDP
jgi:hypothetical protein